MKSFLTHPACSGCLKIWHDQLKLMGSLMSKEGYVYIQIPHDECGNALELFSEWLKEMNG